MPGKRFAVTIFLKCALTWMTANLQIHHFWHQTAIC